MSRPKLILVGAGGHAKACIDVIERCGTYEIAGLVGLPGELGTTHLGYPVISDGGDLPSLVKRYQFALVAVGQISSADIRVHLFQQLREAGFVMPTIISPLAHVSAHSTVGAGSVVMHAAVVNAGAVVGRNCIVNTKALIEHDASIGDHSHVATGAILNGGVRVGCCTFVGSGSVLKEGVVVGHGCFVGMGISVRHDLANGARVAGETRG